MHIHGGKRLVNLKFLAGASFLLALLFFFANKYGFFDTPPILLPTHSAGSHTTHFLKNALPIRFEENRGQTHEAVYYLSHGNGYTMYFMPTEMVITLNNKKNPRIKKNKPTLSVAEINQGMIKMQFVEANKPHLFASEQMKQKSHYFRGHNKYIDIPNYAKVHYQNLYPGIDMVFHGQNQQLEYDIHIAPEKNPDVVRFTLEGTKSIQLAKNGDLLIEAPNGMTMRMKEPLIYQMIDQEKHQVWGKFVLVGKQISFAIGSYDKKYTLVIDPMMRLGEGSGTDEGKSIVVDKEGNAYVTGYTNSISFPTKGGLPFNALHQAQDVFITKLNPQGSELVYSTYLGGNGEQDSAHIAVDNEGNAYIVGTTSAKNFPTTPDAVQKESKSELRDAFVVKLNAAGNKLLYATYLGGSDNNGGRGIAIDASGNAHVTGYTNSSDFPLKNPLQRYPGRGYHVFLTKLNSQGTALIYSTYLGGHSGKDDESFSIAIDQKRSVYIIGVTSSDDFPVTAGAFQTTFIKGDDHVFVTKISPAGDRLVYSTLLGGTGIDIGSDIEVDEAGNAYVTGYTNSRNFPVTPKAMINKHTHDLNYGFVTKLNPDGSDLIYSTFLGGSGADEVNALVIDRAGNVYVTGITKSTDFPIKGGISPNELHGLQSAFVTQLGPKGDQLIYSTYLGGGGNDGAMDIAIDADENVYVTGFTDSGVGLYKAFPTSKNAFQKEHSQDGASEDAFVAKINSAGNKLIYSTYLGSR